MNEVAQARVILSDAVRRARYDRQFCDVLGIEYKESYSDAKKGESATLSGEPADLPESDLDEFFSAYLDRHRFSSSNEPMKSATDDTKKSHLAIVINYGTVLLVVLSLAVLTLWWQGVIGGTRGNSARHAREDLLAERDRLHDRVIELEERLSQSDDARDKAGISTQQAEITPKLTTGSQITQSEVIGDLAMHEADALTLISGGATGDSDTPVDSTPAAKDDLETSLAADNIRPISLAPVKEVQEEFLKLTAMDADPNELFSKSLAVSGNIVVIGKPLISPIYPSSAYVFDLMSGKQLFKLTAVNNAGGFGSPAYRSAQQYWFGRSVAVDGKLAVIGAPDRYNRIPGAAYIFDINTGKNLFKSRGGFKYGISVAISGNTALIGSGEYSIFKSGVRAEVLGAAYLFDVRSGKELFRLTSTDSAWGDEFGNTVAVSGNIAVVGAGGIGRDGEGSGSVYVFDVTLGKQLFKLSASDAVPGNRFGNSVAVSGNTIVVGAPGDDNQGNHGSVYVYDGTTGQELFKLSGGDAIKNGRWERFGRSVAINHSFIAVGAYENDELGSAGSVYVFDALSGRQLSRLTSDGTKSGDCFGSSVAVSDNRVVVGAPFNDDMGQSSGTAYVYNVTDDEMAPPDDNRRLSLRDSIPNVDIPIPGERPKPEQDNDANIPSRRQSSSVYSIYSEVPLGGAELRWPHFIWVHGDTVVVREGPSVTIFNKKSRAWIARKLQVVDCYVDEKGRLYTMLRGGKVNVYQIGISAYKNISSKKIPSSIPSPAFAHATLSAWSNSPKYISLVGPVTNGSRDLHVYDLLNRRLAYKGHVKGGYEGEVASFASLAVSSSGRFLAYGDSEDATIRILPDGAPFMNLPPVEYNRPTGYPRSFIFDSEDEILISHAGRYIDGSGAGVIQYIDLASRQVAWEIDLRKENARGFNGFSFSQDGRWVFIGTSKYILIVDRTSGRPVSRIQLLNSKLLCFSENTNGDIVTLSTTKTSHNPGDPDIPPIMTVFKPRRIR